MESGNDHDLKLVEPPDYFTEEHIFDICFHPTLDFIAYANIEGEARMYGNTNHPDLLTIVMTLHRYSRRSYTTLPVGHWYSTRKATVGSE